MRAKLFAIGFGVAVIFPVAAHFLIFLFSPPPKWEAYHPNGYAYSVESQTGTKEERLAKAKEQDLKQKQYEAAEKHERAIVFYGLYPLGLLAIVVGTAIGVASVGAGLIFGGVFALADGCFSSWDIVPGWVTISAVIFALVVISLVGSVFEMQTRTNPPASEP